MDKRRLFVLGVVFLILVFGGCKEAFDPDRPQALPYRFSKTEELGRSVTPADLNGDGTDEMLGLRSTTETGPKEPNALLIETQDGKVIAQVNFGQPVQEPYLLDVTGDGQMEIFVPFVRGDSLFLSVLGPEGEKQNQLFVTGGEPRREPEGTLAWDPKVRDLFWTDTNGDGTRELLTIVQTYYARLPRGVWIHRLPSGTLLGKAVVGATLDQWHLGQFDEDPHKELLVAAGAANNGAEAGGMSDRFAYHYAFDLGSTPTVQWKREFGSPQVRADLRGGDLDGDGAPEYVAFARRARGRPIQARFRLIDPGTGATRQVQSYSFVIQRATIAQIDDDGDDELLVLDASGTVHVLGVGLAEEQRVHLGAKAGGIERLPDVTGDGRDDVLVARGGETLLLGADLGVQAALGEVGNWQTVQRGIGKQPFLYREGDSKGVLYRLEPSPYWWIYRYGPWALGLLGIGLLIGGGYGAWMGYRRFRHAQAVQEQLRAVVDDRLFLARPDGTVTPLNPPARRWLSRRVDGEVEDGRACPSELASWIESLDPETEQSVETRLTFDGQDRDAMHIGAHPLLGTGEPRWLLRVEPVEKSVGANDGLRGSPAWRLMARRVAHDLKNPLTSILLTVRRLRHEHRDRVPEAAEAFQRYTDRIENRIRRLRRTTLNFMKLVGDEGPSLTKGSLAELARSVAERLRKDLASDISLTVRVEDDLPASHFDHDQMQSVLENLVDNATDALSEGGEITVSLWMERGLQPSSDTEPDDYVMIEVVDTGEGMGPEAEDRAFEPGFTTDEEGTGLGLSIVQKVVRDHGGTAEIESEKGLGTAVTLYLPVSGTPRRETDAQTR